MSLLLLRSLLSFLATVISITAALSIVASPKGASDPAMYGVLVIFLPVALITGPFWPNSASIDKWSRLVEKFPRASGLVGYLVMTIVGALAAFSALNHPDKSPQFRKLRLVYELLGEQGVGFIWFFISVGLFLLGLIGCIRTLRHDA